MCPVFAEAADPSVRVSVRVPATSANLGPGFDALGLALSLYNDIVATSADRVTVRIEGEGMGRLPTDESNIVAQGVRLAFRGGGTPLHGVRPDLRQPDSHRARTRLQRCGLGGGPRRRQRPARVASTTRGVAEARRAGGRPPRQRGRRPARWPHRFVWHRRWSTGGGASRSGGAPVDCPRPGDLLLHRGGAGGPARRRCRAPMPYSTCSAWPCSWRPSRSAGRGAADHGHGRSAPSAVSRAALPLDAARRRRRSRRRARSACVLSGAGPSLLAVVTRSADAVARAMEAALAEAGLDGIATVLAVDTAARQSGPTGRRRDA